MLNIFRLSKMLLISGMVLAFSCVTFNANLAYAKSRECKEITKQHLQAEKDLEDGKKEYGKCNREMWSLEKEVDKLKEVIQYLTNDVSTSGEYKSMLDADSERYQKEGGLEQARKDLEAAEQEYKKKFDDCDQIYDNRVEQVYNQEQALKSRKDEVCSEGYKSDKGGSETDSKKETAESEKNNNAGGGETSVNEEKSQKSRSKRKEAADKKDIAADEAIDALLSINDDSRDVDKAEKAMKTACDENPDSEACTKAKNDYAEASKKLEETKESYNKNLKDKQQDYNKAVRKDARAQKKDDKRADKAVEKAQKDVDKYCTLGHASYNADKCTKARGDLDLAEADETYVKNHGEKDTRTQDQKISDIARAAEENAKNSIKDPKSAGQDYVSDSDVESLEEEKIKKDTEAAQAESNAQNLKKARDTACKGNEKSKKCREADEKYQAAQDNADNLRQEANSAYSAYQNASTKNATAKEIIGEKCPENEVSDECKKAREQLAQKEREGDKNYLSNARQQEKAAEQKFDNARKEEAKICNQDPDGTACSEAKARTRAAQDEKNAWSIKAISKKEDMRDGSLDDATADYVSKADVNALNDDIRKKEKEIQNLESQKGSLETGVAVACKREKSRACKEAKAELEAYNDRLNTLKEEKGALEAEKQTAKDQNDVSKSIIGDKCPDGNKSKECLDARQTMSEQEYADAKAWKEETNAKKATAQADFDKALKAAEEACGQNIPESEYTGSMGAGSGSFTINGNGDIFGCHNAIRNLRQAKAELDYADKQSELADNAFLEAENLKLATDLDILDAKCEDPNSKECLEAKLAHDPDSQGGKIVFGETGAVFTQATPPSGHVFSYTTEDGDVFEIVTRRIAFIILYIKPIVYIFAGFGLIAVAFGAIFNKMSWRHFSYVAIGLFMVANVGRLIEFVVTPYIEQNGQWVSDVGGQKQTEIQRDLSSAFGDTYHTFGNYIENPTIYREIDLGEFIEIGKEVKVADSGILDGLAKKRGFCEGSSGSGWSNFKSCINDIVGTVKNVGNMVKGAVNTVYGVAGQARKAKDAIVNISNSFKNMKGASASEIFNEFSNIMHYTDDFNDAVTGTIDTIGDGAINILNEAGDIGSAESYGGQSMSDILADGFFNISGTARSVEGLASDIQREKDAKKQGVGVYNKDGVFGKDGFGGFGKPSSNKTTSGTSASGTSTSRTSASGTGSSTTSSSGTGGATSGTSGSGTANVTHTSEKTYEDAVRKTNNMYSDIQKQERELNNLKNQMAQAQKAADEACKEGSALCDVYKAQSASYDAMIKAGESKLSDTKSAYDTAKSENDQLYEQMLVNNRANAEDELETQKTEATKVCKGDPTSAECVNALKKVNDATTKLAKAIEEQEKRTKASYKETTEQKQGADNSTKYDIAVDNVNDLYKKEQAKEKELAIVGSEINKLQKQMDENNCSSNQNSDICKALGDQKSSLEGYKTEQENALKDIQKDKTNAEKSMEQEYKDYLQKNVDSAEAAQKSAQTEVDKACAGNNSNSESCLKARNKLIESINNVAKAKEEQKKPTDRTQTNEEKDAKRKQTQEDKERQQALDEYDSKTNPEKVAQDLKNTYSELQEEVNRAKSTYNEKKQRTKATKEAYETAKAKADQSGKSADIAEAKRLEKEYKKAQKEEKAAEKNLGDLDAKTKSTKTYYLQRAIDSETYKQAKYKAEMATISSDVSALEADITAKRKEAEKLADRIMKLSSKSSLTDDEKIAIVTLRKEYEIAKAEYNQMKNEITQAKNRFEQLKNMYNKSVNDKKALEDELKSLT